MAELFRLVKYYNLPRSMVPRNLGSPGRPWRLERSVPPLESHLVGSAAHDGAANTRAVPWSSLTTCGGFHGDLMVILWDFMRFHGDLMPIQWDFMRFNCE